MLAEAPAPNEYHPGCSPQYNDFAAEAGYPLHLCQSTIGVADPEEHARSIHDIKWLVKGSDKIRRK